MMPSKVQSEEALWSVTIEAATAATAAAAAASATHNPLHGTFEPRT